MKTFLYSGIIGILFIWATSGYSQRGYKDMMDDNSFNVYEVIKAAEKHFETHSKGKGFGWKDYQRWREKVEPMFAPVGDRSLYDWDQIMRQFEKQRKYQSNQKWNGAVGYYWENRGPDVIENYFPTAFASGVGRVEALWGGSSNGDTIYLGARGGGFWKTTDGGGTWHVTTDTLASIGVIDIDVRPDSHNVVFIVSRNSTGMSRGLWKSTDFGESWKQTSLNTNGANIKELVIANQRPDTMYVSATNGLYRSFDGGDTWTRAHTSAMIDLEIAAYDPATLFFIKSTSSNTVSISTDAGSTISHSSVISSQYHGSSQVFIRVTPAEPGWVYFMSSWGIWRSEDSARTFSFRGSTPAIYAFGVSDTDPNLLILGGIDQYASFDGGSTNSLVCDYRDHTRFNYVHADARVFGTWNGRMYLGTDGYLAVSPNGFFWTIKNFKGTSIQELYRTGLAVTDASLTIVGSQDNGTSVLIDSVWHQWRGEDGMECHIDQNNSNIWYGTAQYGKIFTGEKYGQEAFIIPYGFGRKQWLTPSIQDPSNDNTLFIASDTLFKSNDNGRNWLPMYAWSRQLGGMDNIAISPVDSNTLYISRQEELWRSVDNGQSWLAISAGLPGQVISRIACHPSDPDEVTVILRGISAGNKVFQSRDKGSTWNNISGSLPNVNGQCLVYEEGPDNRLYIGMDVGVYYIDNNTPTWALYMDSLPAVQITDIDIHHGAHQLVVSTWGRGVWATNLVGRKDFPQVVKIDLDPLPTREYPRHVDTVHTRAVVRDPDGRVTEVKLYWGTDGVQFPNVIPMPNISGDTFATAYPIPPGYKNTNVYLRIMSVDNTQDTTWTERIVYRIHEAQLCWAWSSQNGGFNYIDEVSLSPGFVSQSQRDWYSDFRTRYFPQVMRGDSLQLNVHMWHTFVGDSIFAWIDWNRDYVFDEQERLTMSRIDHTRTSHCTFIVPQSAVADTLVMRIRHIHDSLHIADPCGIYKGEIEDYSLVVNEIVSGFENESGNVSLHNSAFSVFPNPTSEQLTILHDETSLHGFRLFDVFGKKVIPASAKQEKGRTTLELGNMPAGLYLLELSDGKQVEVVKVVKH